MICKTIAHIETDFKTKFGVPRQAGLVPELEGRIVFEPLYRNADALRGLEGFSHLWLIWEFSESVKDRKNENPKANCSNASSCAGASSSPSSSSLSSASSASSSFSSSSSSSTSSPFSSSSSSSSSSLSSPSSSWSPTVRPPRLGGNVRMGVFATRSPFRPNPIGLSSVQISRIELNTPDGPVIYVKGADLMNGTPILDIKPYLPFTDSHPEALGGFTEQTRQQEPLEVIIPDDIRTTLLNNIGTERLTALCQVLSQDPRPHYQQDPERVYGLEFAGIEVHFRVEGTRLIVQ